MATNSMREALRHLREALGTPEDVASDGQLLERFLAGRDEAAFAVLVRRHGPMVWGVCRRILDNPQDAEDAFQATFLVLVRKGRSVAPRELVANWLYGVARQTALKARALAGRRAARERQVAAMPEPEAAPQGAWCDLRPLLDEELSRLPGRYRSAVVLCELEGKTRKEAATELGVPEGTVAGWLARARAMLARRLTRRGVALSGATLAEALAEGAASAAVPGAVVSSTVKAASALAAGGAVSAEVASLTEGVLKAMLVSKFKVATAVFLLIATMGAGSLIYRGQAAPDGARKPGGVFKRETVAMKELEKLRGTWVAVSAERQGKELPEAEAKKAELRLVIDGAKFTIRNAEADRKGMEGMKGTLAIDPAKKPKTIDLTAEVASGRTSTAPGIYELDGDTLKLCYGKERPAEFKTRPGREADQRSYVFKREKK